ncbi:hypothetical protein [Scandinavium goeteborgense]|uniref:Uncharacterized protein n=1 Tax=Scandinavium goeteborgense TaxID=1851514 RepID=A0A4R6DSR8_SCAGO|nr:hypothetical protein [Scandinavium goeteborgense]TDN48063.1 hypothetical protein EC847_12814 [Scandinavium goeteborgense]
MKDSKATIDQTTTVEAFADLLADEGLSPEALEDMLAVLAEIKLHTASFQANTSELVELAALHSPKFQALPAERKRFYTSVLSMPVFFYTLPLSEEEADEWEKLNDKEALAWERKQDL